MSKKNLRPDLEPISQDAGKGRGCGENSKAELTAICKNVWRKILGGRKDLERVSDKKSRAR